ncbi:MAG: hypothetical protein CO186_10245 [Zetaproteobacteria bacterium CG_4_9_14_3_um_filter_49_83]|nr:MAG: hypothetical protein AUJ56_07350 [Zetaproteobacteria bacterium CG1_02_49_23]PIQ34487.1 MAG: hypothetical protein COW62_01380 [Zetaproteobacteria bacterium CG17_big_fil_post_rev_8_21_14_2_50_50_13]PIV29252.1 MAG: hypothetical protein COS35_12995 [Zetaproteobacteria bacterium CG02_land_8_20_14_3_00_50_9]PIY56086.1 MAG: hypothetical protein COZ00_06005 [Zetaproteobacteria bacterium CG_4_10_14_0_8_um_filter_49_80]PJA34526.1 MAG: hypothetical protein CO186_10245 [Zetaproteobacteria bacterium
MTTDSKNQALRPAFTHMLANHLLRGESINLLAPHGYGRRETLQDLRAILPTDIRVLYADMKDSLDDCPATLHAIARQVHSDSPAINHLGQLIIALSEHRSPFLLILHNFDLIRNKAHDPLFDSALLPYLTNFSDHPQLSLLVVSEEYYPDWQLPCTSLPIPPLNIEESSCTNSAFHC